METETRLMHWYDVERHAIACGAPGQTNATKHPRGVTCAACLACIDEGRSPLHVVAAANDFIQ